MQNSTFIIDITRENKIAGIKLRADKLGMNWAEGASKWGSVKLREGLDLSVKREFTEKGLFRETYIFTNSTAFDIFTQEGEVAVAATFNDSYHDAKTCEEMRCHTHINCGGESSWIMALRMGGYAPHLGLMLIKGSLISYSVERDLKFLSNDRGDFWLNVSPFHLRPGENYELSWEIFPHNGKADFRKRLLSYENYIDIDSDKFVYFKGENIRIRTNAEPEYIEEKAEEIGEKLYTFKKGNTSAEAKILVLPEWSELLYRRCRFIAEKQQYSEAASALDGAYLIYDNETKRMFYSHNHDHNGGRERLAMGIVIAQYLQENEDDFLMQSLKKYIAYVERELFDGETGVVYNDVHRCNDWNRLYNYPWMSTFFIELYKLFGEKRYLIYSAKAMKAMYAVESLEMDGLHQVGGMEFYPLTAPMCEIVDELIAAGENDFAEEMRGLFLEHAENLYRRGTDFPASEVNYEQSIIAPATEIMLMAYKLSGDEKFLRMGETILGLLELFSGFQPNYNMNEVAIRHWDGHWFGKLRRFGDTYPHYWSSTTGSAYELYSEIMGNKEYARLAEANLRGSLSMIFPDGSASCAMVYPYSVNGRLAASYDPWANDQDWALYFYIKHLRKQRETK